MHHFTCTSSHLIYYISCSRCGMLYIALYWRPLRTRFGEHRRAVIGNDANQPVARYFNTGNHSVSDMEIRVLCPISGSNGSRKRHEMCLISKLGTVHPHGINGRLSCLTLSVFACLKQTLTVLLKLALKHEQQCFIRHKDTRRSRVSLGLIKHALRMFKIVKNDRCSKFICELILKKYVV